VKVHNACKRSDRSRFLTEDAALIGLAAGARSVSGQNAEVPGNVSLGTKAYERSLVGVAALTLAGDSAFSQMRAIYESDGRLRVPPIVFNAVRNAPETITS